MHYSAPSRRRGCPTIVKIGNLKIQIFADDHNPPHFHVVTPDFEILAGRIDRRSLEVALAWAALKEAGRLWKMNGAVSIRDSDVISVGAPLPRIREAVALEGRKIRVTFDDGRSKIVDLAPVLASRRFYIPLRDDDALFRSFRVSEYRNAIEWGEDLDFSAVWLDALPTADFTNLDFRRAMDDLDMTLDGMAAALEISRRLVAAYRKDKPVPRHIAFATRYLVEHKPATPVG